MEVLGHWQWKLSRLFVLAVAVTISLCKGISVLKARTSVQISFLVICLLFWFKRLMRLFSSLNTNLSFKWSLIMMLFTTTVLDWAASASGQSIPTGTSASGSGSIIPLPSNTTTQILPIRRSQLIRCPIYRQQLWCILTYHGHFKCPVFEMAPTKSLLGFTVHIHTSTFRNTASKAFVIQFSEFCKIFQILPGAHIWGTCFN